MPAIVDLYQLKLSDEPVNLTVTIGHSAKAETTVFLDGVKTGTCPDSFEALVGKNQELKGSRLDVRSYVGKILEGHDPSSVVLRLSGGMQDKEWIMTDPSPDNPVVFLATILLSH